MTMIMVYKAESVPDSEVWYCAFTKMHGKTDFSLVWHALCCIADMHSRYIFKPRSDR